ncbi:MAG: hypothetical protein ACYDBB_12895 [Armatimonadota bacterium]
MFSHRRRPLERVGVALFLVLLFAVVFTSAGYAMTPAEYLRSQPVPHFKAGNTLPSLTKWSWPLPVDLRIELSKNWGYALELGYVYPNTLERDLANPNSDTYKLCALAKSDPKRYGLLVYLARTFPSPLRADAWTYDATGKLAGGTKIWSPEAPDAIFQQAATEWTAPLATLRARGVPISMVLNGGEYALPVVAGGINYWSQDPKVMKAKGSQDWFSYISQRKAHQEMFITNAVRNTVPDRQLYLYYITSGGAARNRWGGWTYYMWGYQWMKPVSDLPNESLYYEHSNDGWTPRDAYTNDLLTQALNSVGYQIMYNTPLSYNWVCGGWPQANKPNGGVSDIARYMGFLKCNYTAGMIGGIAGYFAYPPGGFGASFNAGTPPNWLQQMTALAEVHALFSYQEPFLRQGSLLPGPSKHVWSKGQPAYEFPTGSPGTRVLARKMNNTTEWLITAWAADGKTRMVTVTIPEYGTVNLQARACGSVYYASIGKTQKTLTLIDVDGMHPTANMK